MLSEIFTRALTMVSNQRPTPSTNKSGSKTSVTPKHQCYSLHTRRSQSEQQHNHSSPTHHQPISSVCSQPRPRSCASILHCSGSIPILHTHAPHPCSTPHAPHPSQLPLNRHPAQPLQQAHFLLATSHTRTLRAYAGR